MTTNRILGWQVFEHSACKEDFFYFLLCLIHSIEDIENKKLVFFLDNA